VKFQQLDGLVAEAVGGLAQFLGDAPTQRAALCLDGFDVDLTQGRILVQGR
jgi:hypothetical protein